MNIWASWAFLGDKTWEEIELTELDLESCLACAFLRRCAPRTDLESGSTWELVPWHRDCDRRLEDAIVSDKYRGLRRASGRASGTLGPSLTCGEVLRACERRRCPGRVWYCWVRVNGRPSLCLEDRTVTSVTLVTGPAFGRKGTVSAKVRPDLQGFAGASSLQICCSRMSWSWRFCRSASASRLCKLWLMASHRGTKQRLMRWKQSSDSVWLRLTLPCDPRRHTSLIVEGAKRSNMFECFNFSKMFFSQRFLSLCDPRGGHSSLFKVQSHRLKQLCKAVKCCEFDFFENTFFKSFDTLQIEVHTIINHPLSWKNILARSCEARFLLISCRPLLHRVAPAFWACCCVW